MPWWRVVHWTTLFSSGFSSRNRRGRGAPSAGPSTPSSIHISPTITGSERSRPPRSGSTGSRNPEPHLAEARYQHERRVHILGEGAPPGRAARDRTGFVGVP